MKTNQKGIAMIWSVRLPLSLPLLVLLVHLLPATAQAGPRANFFAADQELEKKKKIKKVGKKPLGKVTGEVVEGNGKPVKSEVQDKSSEGSGSGATTVDGSFNGGKNPLVKVAGRVVDRDGKPFKSEVQYKSSQTSGSVATTADGLFNFEAPAGTYEFTVKLGGKAASVGSKDISSGKVELIW